MRKSLNTIITLDQIAKYAPSALQTQPIEGASNKYSFVSTMDAVSLIMSKGWKPYWATESKVRKQEKDGFQKHIIKFTMNEMLSEVGDERLDLLLFNSHDCGSAFRVMVGIFRLVCSNGLVVGNNKLSFHHKHVGFDQDMFLDSVDMVSESGHQISEKVEDFKLIEMNPNEQGAYAKAAAELISDQPEEIDLYDLTKARRSADRQDNLWTLYNRTQENITKGGIRRHGKTEAGKPKKRTRKVKSIDRDIKLNKALWTLTEEMAKLKVA